MVVPAILMFTLSACLQGIPSKTKAIHKPTLNLLTRVALAFNPDPDLCTNDLVGVSNFTIVPGMTLAPEGNDLKDT